MDVTRVTGIGRRDLLNVAKSVYSLVIFLALWEIVAQAGLIHYYFLPPLSDVLLKGWELVVNGRMIQASILTLKRAFLGLLIATVFGVPIGVLIARNRVVEWFFDPIITIGYPVPIIALIPVFMLWFGIGDISKIILVGVGTFWPIAVNARNSARAVDQNLIWSARMMGTPRRNLIWKVIMPDAAPGIITGIQIALPLSLIITFVFEMVAGGGGLGFLEIQGVRSFTSTQTYATLIAIMLIGFALDAMLRRIRRRLLAWA